VVPSGCAPSRHRTPRSASWSRRRNRVSARSGSARVPQQHDAVARRRAEAVIERHRSETLVASGSSGSAPARLGVARRLTTSRRRWACSSTEARRAMRRACCLIVMHASGLGSQRLPNVEPGDGAADQHPLDLRRALEDRENPGVTGSFRSSAAYSTPCYQHGFSTPRPR